MGSSLPPAELPVSTCPYLENVPGPGGLTYLNQMSDPSLAWLLAQVPAKKTCARSSTIRSYVHMLNIMIGACHLLQIRVCPQLYVFLILWNKVELIHWSLSPGGLPPSVLMGHIQRFLSSLLPLFSRTDDSRLRGERRPPPHICAHMCAWIYFNVWVVTIFTLKSTEKRYSLTSAPKCQSVE